MINPFTWLIIRRNKKKFEAARAALVAERDFLVLQADWLDDLADRLLNDNMAIAARSEAAIARVYVDIIDNHIAMSVALVQVSAASRIMKKVESDMIRVTEKVITDMPPCKPTMDPDAIQAACDLIIKAELPKKD